MTYDTYLAIAGLLSSAVVWIYARGEKNARFESVGREIAHLMQWKENHEREDGERRIVVLDRIAQTEKSMGRIEVMVQSIFQRIDSIDRKLEKYK